MTREEEIRQEALNYAEKIDYDLWLDTEHPKSYAKMLVMATAEDNAKWADEHPKNPWRDASKELPLKENYKDGLWGQEVLARTQSGSYYRMRVRENGEWQNLEHGQPEWWLYTGKVTHWMPIPELQEGGEE